MFFYVVGIRHCMFAQTLCVLLLFIPLGKDLNRNMFLSTLLCPVFKHLGSMPWVNSMLQHMVRIGKTFLWITLSSDGTSQSELQLHQHNGARVEMSLSSIYFTFNAWIRIPNAWKIMEHCPTPPIMALKHTWCHSLNTIKHQGYGYCHWHLQVSPSRYGF